jgi:transposase
MCDYIVCKRANQGNPLHTAPLKTPSISRGSWALGRYILAVPMRKVTEVSLDVRQADHPKKACELMASRRFGRYLTMDARGRLRINATKVAAEAKDDGTCVVTTNDDTLDAEDVALGYTSLRLIEGCFRRMKTTGLQTRPIDHGRPHRIIAHVKLCVLALLLERAAEIRCQQTWRSIRHTLDQLKVVRYRLQGKTILQRTQVTAPMAEILRSLGIPLPKKILEVSE